jgi:two-component system, OmpR family, KDP operon response regulator KdpE
MHHCVACGIRGESVSAGRILVVDDDPQIRRVMRVTLTAEGYEVSEVSSGEEALERLHCENYDLVLLDVVMPDIGGIEVCRTLRHGPHAIELAIIMLSVRNAEKDKVDALDAGADDYVTKPFNFPELLARIRAALRRVPAYPGLELKRIKLEDVEIDFSSRHVTGPGRDERFTPKEFDLLSYLIAHPNRTLTHRELLRAVWGAAYGEEVEYLRVFVNRLRWKIEPDRAKPRFLVTDAGVGYRFCLPK